MHKLTTLSAVGAVLACCTVVACGAKRVPPPGPVTSLPVAATAGPEPVAPRHQIPRATRVASPKLLERRVRSALAPDTLDVVRSVTKVARDLAAVYREVAPATVVVQSPEGIATGVVVDPAGWVLTNYHAVSSGETEEFYTRVQVLLGRLDSKATRMTLLDGHHEAYVHKRDKLHDLALLRLSDVSESLPAIKLAQADPVEGQEVIAFGHPVAGLLWSANRGKLTGISDQAAQLSALVTFPSGPAGQDAAQRFQGYLARQQLGLVMQSSCRVLPGDSGGPLVDIDGKLVGLNTYAGHERGTGQVRNHHTHRAEIAKFLQTKPERRIRTVPDPWAEGGGEASYRDADADGRVDMLTLKGRRPCRYCPEQSLALFVDVDQDSFGQLVVLPALAEVYEKRKFDAELVLLRLENRTLTWYDTDNDGDFDVLLVDHGSSGRSTRAYRIRANGELEAWSSLARGATIRLSLFRHSELRQRLARIAGVAFPSDFVEKTTAWQGQLPHPLGRAGSADAVDLSRDGTNDAVLAASAFAERVIVDADQNWADRLGQGLRLERLLESGLIDAEMTVVNQGTHTWVWYDTDDDQRFDLVLHSPRLRLYVATDAWQVRVPDGLTPLPEHVGRKLIRADLLRQPGPGSELLRSMIAGRGFLGLMSAVRDSGLETFPEPVGDHRGHDFSLLKLKGASRAVVSIQGQGSDGYLMDLDGDSARAGHRLSSDLARTVKDGGFDAELAYFHRNGLSWVYYDSDNQGGYDVLVYTAETKLGLVQRGYVIKDDGSVTLDPELANHPMVRPSLFKRSALGRRLRQLASQVFMPRWVEG